MANGTRVALNGKHKKDPQSNLDYPLTWEDWLEPGDDVVSVTWTVPAGLTKTDESLASPISTVWLSGGTTKVKYEVIAFATTAAGRTEESALEITML